MTWLDITMLIICLAAITRGAMTGFIMQVASLAGIILGAIFAGKAAEWLYPLLDNLLDGNSQNITAPASYILGFILILIAVHLIGRLINTLVKVTLLSVANRIAGSVFSLGKWILITSIILNLTTQIDQGKNIIKEDVRNNSYCYAPMIDIAQIIIPYLRFENITIPEADKESSSTQLLNI